MTDRTSPPPDQPVRPQRTRGERIAAVGLIVVCGAMFVQALGYGLWQRNQPGPGLFPALVSALMVVLSLLWLITKPAPRPSDGLLGAAVAAEEAAEAAEASRIERAGRRTIVFTIVWALIPIFALDKIGFVLTTTAYVGGMLIFIARIRWWLVLPITAVVSVLVNLGADRIGIALPDPFRLLWLLGV
ncbi:MAG: tripartite tricarboxylate transporter TctB family protein [Propionibacteriaceae bacterium]|jgi:hypothetical protein|nr:tripartite tricarboxylate transporter TctB family protein [Propionibacteriaceae bacterium]